VINPATSKIWGKNKKEKRKEREREREKKKLLWILHDSKLFHFLDLSL